jgi:hypothetical protein
MPNPILIGSEAIADRTGNDPEAASALMVIKARLKRRRVSPAPFAELSLDKSLGDEMRSS